MITNRSNYTRLKENLEYLNLKQFNLRLDEIIELTQNRTMSVIDILLKLTDYEVDVKKQNVKESMIKVANFPYNRSLDNFDFLFNSDINELEIRNLASLNFIENNKNLIFIGNSGVGKTHLATAIGRLAASSRYSTYFIKCHDLIANLKAALAENRLEQRLKHYSKYRLLIIDEIGYLPLEKGDERLLFQLIDRRYEKKSIIATSNIPFSEWATLFSDDKVASAILDRLLHHAHVVPIIGNSYRLKDHVSFEKLYIFILSLLYIFILTFTIRSTCLIMLLIDSV